MTTGLVRTLLRLEGAAAFALSLALYLRWGGSAWLFVPLFLAVDASMIGYLAGPRLGALIYNAVHSWAPAIGVLAVGLALGDDAWRAAGALLGAHVGFDRLAGYGLKYPTSFGDTHLGRIGRSRSGSPGPG